jgi:uncharacterized protein (UPF0371 family)
VKRPAHAATQVHEDWWQTLCGTRLEQIGSKFFVHATENGYPVNVSETEEGVACGRCLRSSRVRGGFGRYTGRDK